jgi:predicted cupin superfamily sugar epimerase
LAAVNDPRRIIESLGLEPHPSEGGFFAETYRSRYRTGDGRHTLGTAIYYLLTPESFSAMHRLASDEIFHFYLGDPVEMLLLEAGGAGRISVLGPALESGQRPQIVVPAGTWQGSRLAPGGRLALLGTTVTPGFEFADFELGDGDRLAREWPAFANGIRARVR